MSQISQLFPEVIDASTLQPKLASNIYLPPAVEGMEGTAGTGVVGTIYTINRVDEASGLFDPTSSLYQIVKALLDRGAGPVKAIPSAKTTTPTLVQRQAAWEKLESDETVRLRFTDSEVQADLAALAVSVKNASLINNKQVAIVGMPAATSKAALITAATAIATDTVGAKRTVLVGPAIYDASGTLRGGSYTAAAVGAEVAKNADPSNDLDLWRVQLASAIELDASGIPVFRRRVAAGVAVNDFEDLLQGGVSPLMPARGGGGIVTTHLRTVFTTDTTFDALMTRIIIDQVFIDVRDWILSSNILRLGNTDATRLRVKSGVESVLNERNSWITPVTQADGSLGYNVSVVPSPDMKSITVGYEGTVVRGIQTVKIAPTLTIPA